MRIQQFDYSVDLLQAILWQYSSSTNLLSLINQKQDWYTENQTQFWSDWYNNIFNLKTANSFGLSVWSYILNLPLYLINNPESSDKPLWGFNRLISTSPNVLENTYLNFGNSNFSTRGIEIILTPEEQRFLLRLKYFQLCTRGDITDINSFLNYLITTSNIGYTGTVYALDGLNMTMTYVFTNINFPPNLLQLIVDLDVLPRPAGVGIYYVLYTGKTWGFGIYNENFGNGNFDDQYA